VAEHSNAVVVRRYFDAFAAGDLATMVDLLSEQTVWHLPTGGTRLSQNPTVSGLSALYEMGIRNVEASEGTFRFDVERVFAGDQFAAVISHNTASANGRTLDLHMVIQFKLENGKIVEVWESPDDIDAFSSFWSDCPT
jgi:uncharacterized protein